MIVLITTRDKENREQTIRKEIMEAYTDIYFNHETSSETKAQHFIQYSV